MGLSLVFSNDTVARVASRDNAGYDWQTTFYLVAQLIGGRYFETRFGKRGDTAWLLDSFGLTGSLPQLIRLAGMKYFFMQKLSWNNLESSDTALLVFGNGDGGGGPLNKMLENLRRIRAIGNNNREIEKDCEDALEKAFEALFPKSSPLTSAANTRTPGTIMAYNTTFFPRRDVIQVPLEGYASSLKSQVVQASEDGSIGYALLDCIEGSHVARASGLFADCMPASAFTNGADHFVLRNSSVQITLLGGRITSILDVQLGRELLETGKTGGLVIFEDRPNYWDAWDVEVHHLEKMTPLEFSNISVIAGGPLRALLRAVVKYGKSTITTTISLDAIPGEH
ncbi:galactose mutarotase-like domain-containing protein [Cytidiella melzeri]|nr:galactose mutarotase-like domain-containing protein [Cytidiella melzeri]